MGCVVPKSKAIQPQFRDENLERKYEEIHPYKMLLLGTGNAGKTTFLKQLISIYKNDHSYYESDTLRKLVPESMLIQMKNIIAFMDDNLDEGYDMDAKVKISMIKIRECPPHAELSSWVIIYMYQ